MLPLKQGTPLLRLDLPVSFSAGWVHAVVLQDQADSSQKAEEEEGLRLHLSGPACRELV